ncbi:hypothetical protein PXH80_34020, partial [Mycolicibacterium smegmatis]|nr:hypothetical protein [Mycolicibacterium smegmatis]
FQQRVDVDEFCGGIPQVPAHAPSVRIGRHWVSFAWLAVGALVTSPPPDQQMLHLEKRSGPGMWLDDR